MASLAGRIGYPAGRIGDRGDREIVYVPNVYVPFPAPSYLLSKQGCGWLVSGRHEIELPMAQRYSRGSRLKSTLGVASQATVTDAT